MSVRQREVLQLVARGLTNREIGGAMGIAADTARTHVAAILAKLEVSNRTEATAAYLSWDAEPARVADVLERPAIAVLPVVLDRDDPTTAAVGAGIARDLVARFSRWCSFPVIASSATRDSRGLGDSRAIGRALGAAFLVDAGLRTSTTTWRLDVEVVDAERRHCQWAGSWTFAPDGLFAAQDDVCQAVVAAAYPTLVTTRPPRPMTTRHPERLAPWQLAHEALALQATRAHDANARARSQLAVALARDPQLVVGHYGLGLACYDAVLNQWGPRQAALDGLQASAEQCVALAPDLAEGHYLTARWFQTQGRHDRAAGPLRLAIGCNPSFSAAHALLAQVLLLTGFTDEGLVRLHHARRLSPHGFVAGLAVAHFVCHDYPGALAAAEQAIATNPSYPFAYVIAAAAAWLHHDAGRALAHAGALIATQPGFVASHFLEIFGGGVEAVVRLATALDAIATYRGRLARAQ